ncbi:hypothetical protein MPC1_5630004 [Methylocella tundrae]|nr:hypothetical protein MPC1_5630004 [Methylocella tundrae]
MHERFLLWRRGLLARGLLLFGLLLAFEIFAGLLVDETHREANLAAVIEAEQLHLDLFAFLHDIGGFRDAPFGELRNMNKAIL